MLLVLSKFWLFCLVVMQYLLLQNPNLYMKKGHAVTLEHQSGYSVAPEKCECVEVAVEIAPQIDFNCRFCSRKHE